MRKAFTLIELLVVIAIIGTLSAILFPNFMGARERARDSQRKSDLRQIQKAFEMYRQDSATGKFPEGAQIPAPGSCFSSDENCTGNIYMNKFPTDPLGGTRQYYYTINISNMTYTICACIENTADPDESTDCGSCTIGATGCTAGPCYVVTQP